MRRVASGLVLVGLALFPAGGVRAGLKPATKNESVDRTVRDRLCFAGRFRVERRDGDTSLFGRFVEQVPSHVGHPNAADLGEVRVVRRGDDGFRPEVGSTYCLILTNGSRQGMTVVAFGPDDGETLGALRRVIASPSAFENDATWVKRRALWSKFRRDVGRGETPVLYGEDDALRNILYVKPGETTFPLFLYNADEGKAEPITLAKVLPGVNRITFDHGQFRVWFNGSVESSIGVRDGG